MEGRFVESLREANCEVLALVDPPAKQEGAEHRHEREREEQRTGERKHHGDGHRVEHLPLDARQREDRHVDDGDDDHAEEHRGADLLARGEHHLRALLLGKRAPQGVLTCAEPTDDVLHDDHRAVDDQAEIDGAEAHQVPGDAAAQHAGEGEEER